MTITNDFIARLIKARSALGWSQADLAKASGISATQLSRYEGGLSAPRPQAIGRLAQALNIQFDWLSKGAGPIDVSADGTEVNFEDLPDGSAILTVRPNSELARRMKKMAATAGVTLDELLAQMMETWAKEMSKELDNQNANQVGGDHFEKLRKRVERLEQETGITSTPEPGKAASNKHPASKK